MIMLAIVVPFLSQEAFLRRDATPIWAGDVFDNVFWIELTLFGFFKVLDFLGKKRNLQRVFA
jgi:hypothetical protein